MADTRSVPEWMASEMNARLPDARPATSLMMIRNDAAAIETIATRRGEPPDP